MYFCRMNRSLDYAALRAAPLGMTGNGPMRQRYKDSSHRFCASSAARCAESHFADARPSMT